MNDTTSEPDVPDDTPAAVSHKVRNYNDDRWFEHDGELLFAPSDVERVHARLVQMDETDWETVTVSPMASMLGKSTDFVTRAKIHTDDTDEFLAAFEERTQAVGEEHGGWLTERAEPTVSEQGPIRTDVWVRHPVGYTVTMGGAANKAQKILLAIRDFESWLHQTEVVAPLLEKYNERYPY